MDQERKEDWQIFLGKEQLLDQTELCGKVFPNMVELSLKA